MKGENPSAYNTTTEKAAAGTRRVIHPSMSAGRLGVITPFTAAAVWTARASEASGKRWTLTIRYGRPVMHRSLARTLLSGILVRPLILECGCTDYPILPCGRGRRRGILRYDKNRPGRVKMMLVTARPTKRTSVALRRDFQESRGVSR